MTTWRPLATIPDNGTFDLWVEHQHEPGKGHRRANCHWRAHSPWPPEAPLDETKDRSLVDSHGFTVAYPWKVTHWLALPESPSGDEPFESILQGYEQYATPNWDGEGAEPITPTTLKIARALAELFDAPPHVAPGADGTIGFEWLDGQHKVFLDVKEEEIRAYARVEQNVLTAKKF